MKEEVVLRLGGSGLPEYIRRPTCLYQEAYQAKNLFLVQQLQQRTYLKASV